MKLAINGNIRAKKLKNTESDWADYVFNSIYKLPSLQQVEDYINQHHHLPNVPSALEVVKNGLDLGENQTMLLQKIEELTLYMIQVNKNVMKINEEVEKLKKENTELKKQLKTKKK